MAKHEHDWSEAAVSGRSMMRLCHQCKIEISDDEDTWPAVRDSECVAGVTCKYCGDNCPVHGTPIPDKATPPGLPEKQRIYQHVPPSLFSQLREVRRTCNALIDYLTRAHRPLVGRVPHLNSHRDQRQMNVDIDTLTLAVRELQRRIGGKDDE